MKRLFAVVLTIALVGTGAIFAEGQKEGAEEQITLTGMVRDYSLNYDNPWYSAVEQFEEEHPNVTIELEGLPYNDQREKVLITVGAGRGPDIAQVDTIWLGEFASENIIIDLTDRIAATPGLKDSYIETFQESMSWQGKDYGLWLWTDVRTLFYHKDEFRRAGLDPNDPPETWSELREYARKMNRPDDGVWGYAFPAYSTDHTADRWYPFLWANGGQILSDDYTRAAFNSQAGVEALQLLVDLMNTDGVAPRDLLGIQEQNITQGFIAEKYAMAIKVGSYYSDYADQLSVSEFKEKLGRAPLPVPEGGKMATGSGGWLAGITRDSEHPDLVFEFLKDVVATDNMVPFMLANQSLPTRKPQMARTEDFQEAIPYFDVVQQVLPHTNFRPPIPEYPEISAEIVQAIQAALTMEATPQEALDNAAESVNEILAEREW